MLWFSKIYLNKVPSDLSDLLFCQTFIGDIIIWSDDFESHLKCVEIVGLLRSLRNADITVKLEKCEFCKASLDYIG